MKINLIRSQAHIEKITPSNLKELQLISEQTFFETYSSKNTKEDMDEYLLKNFSKEQLSIELSNSNSAFYFAKIGEEVVGYFKLNFGISETKLSDCNSIEIARIYVIKKYHGKHIGQLLFKKILEIARSRKAINIWLGVWEKNPRAIRFYEKNGFIEFDKHTFLLGSDKQSDLLMNLKI